jgi:hypothetical protein
MIQSELYPRSGPPAKQGTGEEERVFANKVAARKGPGWGEGVKERGPRCWLATRPDLPYSALCRTVHTDTHIPHSYTHITYTTHAHPQRPYHTTHAHTEHTHAHVQHTDAHRFKVSHTQTQNVPHRE